MKKAYKNISLILLICSSVWGQIVETEYAIITKLKGFVSVRYKTTDLPLPVSSGHLIYKGAILQSSSNSIAQIQFITTPGTIYLRPLSEIHIMQQDSTFPELQTIQLKDGEIVVEANKSSQSTFDIVTPTAIANFRDARGMVLLSSSSDASTVYALDGVAKIADGLTDQWVTIDRKSAALLTSDHFFHIDTLSNDDMVNVYESIEKTRQLQATERLVHDLKMLSDSGGIVDPDASFAVLHGNAVDIIALPNPGYTFLGWRALKGSVKIENALAETTQVTLSSSAEIIARFAKSPAKFTINIKGKGKTDPPGSVFLQKGEIVTLQAVPDSGYVFSGWKNPKNVKITNKFTTAIEIKAPGTQGSVDVHFTQKQSAVSFISEGKGKVFPKKKVIKSYQDTIIITARPDSGFRFIEWTASNKGVTIVNPRDTQTTVICDSGTVTVKALFSNQAMEISLLPHEHAKIAPSGNFFIKRSSDMMINAYPDTGYLVSGWKIIRGKAHVRGTDIAYVRSGVPFEIQPIVNPFSFNLDLLQTSGGSIKPSGKISARYNEPLALTAIPSKGKQFIRWNISGGWAKIADAQKESTSIVLNYCDASINAVFATHVCSLKVTSTKGGHTEPSEIIKSTEGGHIALQAIANPNAAFLYWKIKKGKDNLAFSDTLTSPDIIVTTLKGNAAIEAVFSTDAVPLVLITNGRGSTSPKNEIFAIKNTWIPIKATPQRGSSFREWSIVAGTDIQIKDPQNAETEVLIGSTKTVIKALFGKSTILDSLLETNDSLSNIEILYDPAKGTIDPGNKIQCKPGDLIPLRASEKQGYRFKEWRIIRGQVSLTNYTTPATSLIMMKGNAEIEALFESKPIQIMQIQFKDSNGKTKTLETLFQ
jgi:hypothetical protein